MRSRRATPSSAGLVVGFGALSWLAIACGAPPMAEDAGAASDAGHDAGAPSDASLPDDAPSPRDGGDGGDAAPDAGPPGECDDDSDCDDGLFCNGREACGWFEPDRRVCGLETFPPCVFCDEDTDRCCPDEDRDGHAAVGCGTGDDCDDTRADVHPGAWDDCGGADTDCDPLSFGADGDLDSDGHLRMDCCEDGGGTLACGDDCDDTRADVHPGAAERCDLQDQDCDSAIDEGLEPAGRIIAVDCDADEHGDPARGFVTCWPESSPPGCPSGGWGWYEDVDCDDDDRDVHPQRDEETCDGRDDDCDGAVDRTSADHDGDGFPTFACDGTTDCNDWRADIHPGVPELCDGVDDDCDGTRDDMDADGHAAPGTCEGGTMPADDCDDARYETRPGGFERCNGIDDDCDGVIDGSSAYCFGTRASTTECRSGACYDLTCLPGWGACVDPVRCVDDIATDELRCGSCTGRCASSACAGGACTPFDALALTDARTIGRVGTSAVAIGAGGAPSAGGRDWVGVRAVGGGARACFAWADDAITCPGGWMSTAISIAAVVELATADAFACARDAAGRVRCWGRGPSGELGDGAVHATLAGPVEVAGIVDARAIAVGARSACALRASGRIACWGSGYYGTLGDGSSADALAPVEVALPGSATAIAAGDWHACAIDDAGEVWCWGANARGQLGVSGVRGASTPVRVPGVVGATSIAAAGEASCAVAAGALLCWGANESGQLGDGTRIDRGTPTSIGTGIARVVLGRSHGCAVALDGTVTCWGENDDGRLGDGTRVDQLSPVALDYVP